MAGNKSFNNHKQFALTAEWSTPSKLFNDLDKKHHFTLDACASDFNHKCPRYFTVKENGLSQDWAGEVVFCCPPSGRKSLYDWVEKARTESLKPKTKVVMLLPVSTDSQWFKEFIYHQDGVTIEFLPARVSFENPTLPTWAKPSKKTQGGKRSSMVVVMTDSHRPFAVV